MFEEQDFKESKIPAGIDLDAVEQNGVRSLVLVVDDDADTVFLLKQIFKANNFDVMGATSGEEALQKVLKTRPDLVLLDLMMPEMDGWEVFSNLREMFHVPVIFVSAMGKREDIVQGLRTGADDYVTKPFFNQEVVERARSVLRRSDKQSDVEKTIFSHSGLTIDFARHMLWLDKQMVSLSPKEFSLLSLLAKRSPAVVRYNVMGDVVWGGDSPNIRRRINFLVYLIRRKFQQIQPDWDMIQNIDRVGYRLLVDASDS